MMGCRGSRAVSAAPPSRVPCPVPALPGAIPGGVAPAPPHRHPPGSPTRPPSVVVALETSDASRKNTETKQMEEVTHLEALLFSAVLESCVDQLAIIGYVIPVSYEGKTELTDEIEEMIQEELDINNPELASAKQESGETVTSTAPKDTEHKEQQGKTEDEKSPKKRTTRAAEKLRKIQADRQYASDVITLTIKRMEKFGTFNSLKDANEREKARRSKFFDILNREEKAKKEIKSLQKQLQDVKKETEEDLQNRDKVIDSLKDNLLEQTAKLNIESYYLKKNTDLQVHLTQKKCSNAENALENEIQNLKSKIDDEIQVHKETEIFLRQQYQKVKEKLEYWMEKYKKDTEAKDQELEDLKVLKAENLEEMQRYAKECLAFQATIIIDRTEKEMKRKQIEQEALEHKSRIKLQAWWKGTMVRKFLGRYQELEKFLKERAAEREAEKEKAGKKK